MIPKMSRFLFVLSVVLAAFACYCTDIKADWQLVQEKPIRMYRDTRTGLEWSVTIAEANKSNRYAKSIVEKYGLRLPTWEEFRDVVNNNNAIDFLEMKTSKLDFYETDIPGVVFNPVEICSTTKRPRVIKQTWVIGVRK